MTFKNIYNPPFKPMNDGFSVSSSCGVKTFTAFTSEAQKHLAKIVKILNGETSVERYNKNDVISQDAKLCVCGSIILVRGWGMLVGVGGHHIPREEAAKIQNEFIDWVIKEITR